MLCLKNCLLFGNTEVPQPLPITLECCLLTPVAPRPLRACQGKAHRPPWSLSLEPHSLNSPSSRRHGLPRVHQVRRAEGRYGGRRCRTGLAGEELERGLGSFEPDTSLHTPECYFIGSRKLIALHVFEEVSEHSFMCQCVGT